MHWCIDRLCINALFFFKHHANKGLNQLPPSITDLKAAYNRTKLNRAGITFEQAISTEMINKCLHRMALNAQAKQAKQATTNAPKLYWWERI